jgi:hypothetical protein
MKWLYRGLMAVGVVGGSLVSAGILPAVWGGVAVAVGTAAGFFHEAPGGKDDAAK